MCSIKLRLSCSITDIGFTGKLGLQEAASAAHSTAVRHCCSSPNWGAPQRYDRGHQVKVKAGAAHFAIQSATWSAAVLGRHCTHQKDPGNLRQSPAADAERSGLLPAGLPDCCLCKSQGPLQSQGPASPLRHQTQAPARRFELQTIAAASAHVCW